MKAILTKPFILLFISTAIFFAIGCKIEPLLNGNSLLSCSVDVNGKSYDVAISSSPPIGTLTLPYGADITDMKVVAIKVSDKAKASLSAGSSIKVNNDNTFTIVVTAQNGSVKNYTITVVIESNTETKFTSFKFEKANNPKLSSDITINLANIGVKPTQADVEYIGIDSFVPTFSVSTGAKVYVNDVEQKSGVTSQGFLNTIVYKVVAQSKDTQIYKIAINYTSKDFKVTPGGAISGSNTALTTAIIGEYMNGVKVTEIDKRGFTNYLSLTKLKLSKILKKIADSAFAGCSAITGDLTIPSLVDTIGKHAFISCYGFNGNLILPSSLTSIGDFAFFSCTRFNGNLNLPSSLTSIGVGTFQNCSRFDGNLVLPSSLKSIGNYAFAGCSRFHENLSIPSSLTSIGDYVFSGCNGFSGELTIPNSITSIGSNAFAFCKGFVGNLTIPNSVKSIGENAFRDCDGFNGTLTLSSSLISIGTHAFQSCQFNGDLTIPNSVKSIGDFAFWLCRAFDGTLTIPSSVISIGEKAFGECTGFKKLCNNSPANTNNGSLGTDAFVNVKANTTCP